MTPTDDRDTPPGWLEGISWGLILGTLLAGSVLLHHVISWGMGLR